MSAIRILILGALRFMQPTHGYNIRRELETWHAEHWASVAYGSIYFALNKMAAEGLVDAVETDRVGRRPTRTTYRITQRGEEEFQRLLREYWREPKPVIDPFQVALSFMNELPRDELLAALRHRITMGRSAVEALAVAREALPADTPRHIAENLRLGAAHVETEIRWVEETIGKVERGELP